MLSITDSTFCGIDPGNTSKKAIREFYLGLLLLGVDEILVTPEILSVLEAICDPSRTMLKQEVKEIPIEKAKNEDTENPEIRKVCLIAEDDLLYKDYREVFSFLLNMPISFTFCTKDAGLASTALAVEWVLAGGKNLTLSLMGTGGYAPLEEVVLALQASGHPVTQIDTALLKKTGTLWEKLTGNTIPSYKPILGGKVFEVESGVHINGILKNSTNYEPFSPDKVGGERRFSLGKTSGRSALLLKLQEMKIAEKINDPDRLLRMVREKCLRENKGLNDREFFNLSREIMERI